jgi:hypothetical protein
MSNETKLNAEQICYRAKGKILNFLHSPVEHCDVIKCKGGQYFVLRFTKWDVSYPEGAREIGRFTVLGAMLEDGVMSEQRLHAALWQELGRIRGMV